MSSDSARARLDQAALELHRSMERLRTALDRAETSLTPTREELARLQADARAGRLGPRMAELAGHVAARRTTWPDVFAGTSPYSELLRDHLDLMGQGHAESVRRAITEEAPDRLGTAAEMPSPLITDRVGASDPASLGWWHA